MDTLVVVDKDPSGTLSSFGEGDRTAEGSSPKEERRKHHPTVKRLLQTPQRTQTNYHTLGYTELFETKAKWLKLLRPGLVVSDEMTALERCQELGLRTREVICIENGTGIFLCGGERKLADRIIVPVDGPTVYPICTQGLIAPRIFTAL